MMDKVCCVMDIQAFVNDGQIRIREFAFASSNALLHFQVDPQLEPRFGASDRTNAFVQRFVHGLSYKPESSIHTHESLLPGIVQLYELSKSEEKTLVLVKNDQLGGLLASMGIPSYMEESPLRTTWVCPEHAHVRKPRCALSKALALLELTQPATVNRKAAKRWKTKERPTFRGKTTG